MAIKQKIVLQVDVMHCGKCRMKAMEIVAGTEGVISIATEGEDRNQLVLVGVGRKKVGYTSIISIEKVKEDNEAEDEEDDDEKDDDENKYIYYIPYPALPPLPCYAVVSYCNSKLPNPW